MPLTQEEEDRIIDFVLGDCDLFNNPNAYASDHALYIKARMNELDPNQPLYEFQGIMNGGIRTIPGFEDASDETVSDVKNHTIITLYFRIQKVKSYLAELPEGRLEGAEVVDAGRGHDRM